MIDLARLRRSAALGPCLVVLAALALYAPTLPGRQFSIDDEAFIVENRAVTRGAPLASYFLDAGTTASDERLRRQVYRPLRTLAYRALFQLGGARPLPFAVASLLLYASSCVLCLLLLRRWVGDPGAAMLGALWWAVASIHVEAVAYLSALGDQLSLVLELGSLIAALRALEQHPWRRGALSLLLGAAALLAKEMAITEAALLVCLIAGASGWRALTRRRAIALIVLQLVLALAFLALRTHVLGQLAQLALSAENILYGARKAPLLVAHYLWLTVAPLGHQPAYVVTSPSPGALVLALAGLAALLALGWRARRPPLAAALGWFLVSLLPVLRIVPLLADLADRFALLPSVGVAAAIAIGWQTLGPRRGKLVIGVATIALYAGGSLHESRFWTGDAVLWRRAVALAPKSGQARSNLATVLLHEGRVEAAFEEMERARALGFAGDPLRRANALYQLGRATEAEAAVLSALGEDPRRGGAHALYGALRRRAGDLEGAARELALAEKWAPEHEYTRLLAAQLALAYERPAEAAAEFAKIVAAHPHLVAYRYLESNALLLAGQTEQAVTAARGCVSAAREDPRCLAILGRSLMVSGQAAAARPYLERALAELPEGPEHAACAQALAGR